MSEWTLKRFWKNADVTGTDEGFEVRLDGRAIRTPAKALLVLPTKALAEAIAGEWDAQEEVVKPATMPMTRTANSAIDRVAPQMAEVAGLIAEYGGSDLICYRATAPVALEERQAEVWDPLIDWAATELGAPLAITSGIVPVPQRSESLARLAGLVAGSEPFALAALHELVTLSGSLVLGLAVSHGRLSADEAWAASTLDDDWQREQWGADEEADARQAKRHTAFLDAARFLSFCPEMTGAAEENGR